MHRLLIGISFVGLVGLASLLSASPALMEQHCNRCHNDEKAKGKFRLSGLGAQPTASSLEAWLTCLDLVTAEEMPPEDESELTAEEREQIVAFLQQELKRFDLNRTDTAQRTVRRLNNREFANSVRDVLLLEDEGTHQPMANLIGDTLHRGFDTHGETLGFSRFHLEQYVVAVRKVLDATILTGAQPETRQYRFPARRIIRGSLSQNTRRRVQRGANGYFDFLDPRLFAFFEGFEQVPETGWYRIKIRCTGKDRLVYDTERTGIYAGDPIELEVQMGDRVRRFELPDEEVVTLELTEWLAAGTRLRLSYPTDGLRFEGNGNFKFQYRIAHDHLKKIGSERYQRVLREVVPKAPARTARSSKHWSHWTSEWEGPRPRLFDATVEGPFYPSWPPQRQVALLGESPTVDRAEALLRPIAERAWRRPVREGELDEIVALVNRQAVELGTLEGLKEGIAAVLMSPNFLLLGGESLDAKDQFAAKLSTFLGSSIPEESLRQAVVRGDLDSKTGIREYLLQNLTQAQPFLRAFPMAWLELNDINFMAPDPDAYRFYHRKRLSEDMVEEARQFFRHMVAENRPIPEFLTADYSFINADLAAVYGVEDAPSDSRFRRYTFADGRRGGLLGMGAFLTATADSLSTSPIHRAIYVMENLLGMHPKPPPADVEITEPDVRSARTIKEVLEAHRSDPSCASCHQGIDPYGYAFENFGPTGAWRDGYTVPSTEALAESVATKRRRTNRVDTIPIDASARFLNGKAYEGIEGYRQLLTSEVNRDRFVRSFIHKLFLYANGVAPSAVDHQVIEGIVEASAQADYRIVETIAAVVDSPLFRDR